MKRPLFCAAALIAATSTTWSTPSRACLYRIPDFTAQPIAWEGKRLPLNATLQSHHLRSDNGALVVTLRDAAGDEQPADLVDDEDGLQRVVPIAPLTPGRWTLIITGTDVDGTTLEREVAFEILDIVDDAPPAPPLVTYHYETSGDLFPNSCQNQWPTTQAIASLDEATDFDDVAFIENNDNLRFAVADEPIYLYAGDQRRDLDLDFVAIDFAGNRSEVATAVEVSGCGCSEHDAPSFVVGLAALFLIRRRRNA